MILGTYLEFSRGLLLPSHWFGNNISGILPIKGIKGKYNRQSRRCFRTNFHQ